MTANRLATLVGLAPLLIGCTDSNTDADTPPITVTDIDSNTYSTVQIGTQVWMAENLRTTRYQNGDPIAHRIGDEDWVKDIVRLTGNFYLIRELNSGKSGIGAWCYYKNKPKYELPSGKLYNWYAVADRRNLCPKGWHVPTDAEWQQLEAALGMPADELAERITFEGCRGCAQNIGGKLKATRLWSTVAGASNGSGFTALPSGSRSGYDGKFETGGQYEDLGRKGCWWTASEIVEHPDDEFRFAWYRSLYANDGEVNRGSALKTAGYCVRCIKD
jgi:uncharacterized protein (TIGR02145 family)